MKIRIKLSKEENAKAYGASVGDVVEEDFENYVAAVVASEIGNASLEACKAQAVASRTFAWSRIQNDKVISDDSTKAQAFRIGRLDRKTYPNAISGAEATYGLVLTYNGKPISAVYCAGNGGQTRSNHECWGSAQLPYLIAKNDPWDAAVGGNRNGHGVGMSQRGAKYAAEHGVEYTEILQFYYPGTRFTGVYKKEEEPQAMATETKMITPNQLVEKAMIPYKEGWGYIWGGSGGIWTQAKQDAATREQTIKYGSKWVGKRVVDCSGLVYWAFRQFGISVPHGSNSQFKKSVDEKGPITKDIVLKPGAGVFKYDAKLANPYYHVGIYVGNNQVVEARGTYKGVVLSNLFGWTHYGYWKNVDWGEDAKVKTAASTDVDETAAMTNPYVVSVETGSTVNVRMTPAGKKVTTLKEGSAVDVVTSEDGWSKVKFYIMSKYIRNGAVDVDTGSTVNVRMTPNGKKLFVLSEGTKVEVIHNDGEWSEVAFYIMSNFLKKG